MSIATIEVSISALKHNVSFLKGLNPRTEIMAIVKANAYSHGKEKIATLLDDEIDYFGVARLEEGIELRRAGIQSPIVLLEGFFKASDIAQLLKYHLQSVIHTPQQIAAIAQVSSPSALQFWFKLDSGMHRLGFGIDEANHYFTQLAGCSSVKTPINIISHFSSADRLDSDQTPKQIALFEHFIESIQDKTVIGKQSLAASSGILAWPESHKEIIRPGIALYGISPFGLDDANLPPNIQLDLKPVMRLKSELIAIREHKKDESVGYGLIWQSLKDTRLGVVAMGYGDGYPKEVSPGTPVWINGRLVPIVGRVSMDMIIIDLGFDAQEQSGDEVIFWGIKELPVEKIAAFSGMSPYELLTRLTGRAKICYVD